MEERGETFAPGDVIVHNSPYHGASHGPDVGFCVPVFAGEELVGFSFTTAHHLDIGALTRARAASWTPSTPTRKGSSSRPSSCYDGGRRERAGVADPARQPARLGDRGGRHGGADRRLPARRRALPRAGRRARPRHACSRPARSAWTTPSGCCARGSRRCPTASTARRGASTATRTATTRRCATSSSTSASRCRARSSSSTSTAPRRRSTSRSTCRSRARSDVADPPHAALDAARLRHRASTCRKTPG